MGELEKEKCVNVYVLLSSLNQPQLTCHVTLLAITLPYSLSHPLLAIDLIMDGSVLVSLCVFLPCGLIYTLHVEPVERQWFIWVTACCFPFELFLKK